MSNHSPFRLSDLFKFDWNPAPIRKPKVDPALTTLDPLTRSAESITYSVRSLEFWLSPKGQVREWLRNNGRLAVLLAVPTFLVLPTITFALWQLSSWMAALVAIAFKLIVFPILLFVAALVVRAICQTINKRKG